MVSAAGSSASAGTAPQATSAAGTVYFHTGSTGTNVTRGQIYDYNPRTANEKRWGPEEMRRGHTVKRWDLGETCVTS